MPRWPDESRAPGHAGASGTTPTIVVAGPGSSLTIPGIIVSEIVGALASSQRVLRIEVDLGTFPAAGLHRAPSLAAAHEPLRHPNVVRCRVPQNSRARKKAFRSLLGPDVRTAIAYAWPGIDNGWIRHFIQVAKDLGIWTTVVCESLPTSSRVRAVALADIISGADQVVVGNGTDAAALISAFGPLGPAIETHPALSLGGRVNHSSRNRITAFLPKGDRDVLSTLLAAFDAIPDARIDSYSLQVVMRHGGRAVPRILANSHHASHLELISEEISGGDLEELCDASSALSIVDPEFDSRAFSTAIDCGIATVVLADATVPVVGRGYVGGLMANRSQPASVHVAITHALRLAELGFPSPDVWADLTGRIGAGSNAVEFGDGAMVLAPSAQFKGARPLEGPHSFEPSTPIR